MEKLKKIKLKKLVKDFIKELDKLQIHCLRQKVDNRVLNFYIDRKQ